MPKASTPSTAYQTNSQGIVETYATWPTGLEIGKQMRWNGTAGVAYYGPNFDAVCTSTSTPACDNVTTGAKTGQTFSQETYSTLSVAK